MDAIPILALPLKLVRRILPPGFHGIYLWLAICWVLQPVAAVFALRSAGERRLIPALAVAVMSISMPTLLHRYGHSALSSHFLILIALGLYFRMVRQPGKKVFVASIALMAASLLVHPYIMAMVMAVLLAAPMTLLIRRDRRWIQVSAVVGGGILLSAILASVLGYGHASPMWGFGYYSMNLLSPIYPYQSAILRGFQPLDATGGQGEGYQYLGLGVIALILLCDFCLGPRDKLRLIFRNSGILIVCLGLTVFTLSNQMYAGLTPILTISPEQFAVGPLKVLLQFRATGRFFWPVAYVLLVGSIVLVCRYLPKRAAWVVLSMVALLQFAETSQLRRRVRHELRAPEPWVLNTQVLRPLLAESSALSIWPKFMCGADHTGAPFTQVELLASEIAIPVDTAYVGRTTGSDTCAVPDLPIHVAPGQLVVLLPPRESAMSVSIDQWRDICRQIGVLVACSQHLRGRADLPLPVAPEFPENRTIGAAEGGPALPALGFGWSAPQPWGVESLGTSAHIWLQTEAPPKAPLPFTVVAHPIAPPTAGPEKVEVWMNGKLSTVWDISAGADHQYSAQVPPRTSEHEPIDVELRIENPAAPSRPGGGQGQPQAVGLVSFELGGQPANPATAH